MELVKIKIGHFIAMPRAFSVVGEVLAFPR